MTVVLENPRSSPGKMKSISSDGRSSWRHIRNTDKGNGLEGWRKLVPREPEPETSYLELGALEADPAMVGSSSDPEIPDFGLHEESRKLAKKMFRRLLKKGRNLRWRDRPITRLAAVLEAQEGKGMMSHHPRERLRVPSGRCSQHGERVPIFGVLHEEDEYPRRGRRRKKTWKC